MSEPESVEPAGLEIVHGLAADVHVVQTYSDTSRRFSLNSWSQLSAT